jgi:hypothetical protein
MWNRPTEKELKAIPAFYETEKIPLEEKVIYMHFFLSGSDWFAAEYDPRDQIFFGYVILNNDFAMAEWGYFSLTELCEIKVGGFLEIDRDLYFKPTKAKDIDRIRAAWEG